MTSINSIYVSNPRANGEYAGSNTSITDQEKESVSDAKRVAVTQVEDVVTLSPQAIEQMNTELQARNDQQPGDHSSQPDGSSNGISVGSGSATPDTYSPPSVNANDRVTERASERPAPLQQNQVRQTGASSDISDSNPTQNTDSTALLTNSSAQASSGGDNDGDADDIGGNSTVNLATNIDGDDDSSTSQTASAPTSADTTTSTSSASSTTTTTNNSSDTSTSFTSDSDDNDSSEESDSAAGSAPAGAGKAGGPGGAGGASSSDDATTLDQQIAELEKQIKVAEAELEKLAAKAKDDDSAAAQMQAKQMEVAQLQGQLIELQQQQLASLSASSSQGHF